MKKSRSIADQLSAFQSLLSNEMLVCDILEGLGTEYRPFTHALEAQNTPVSFDELYALLLSEETQLRLDSLAIGSVAPPTVNYVHAGCGSGGRWQGRGRGGQTSSYGRSDGSSYARRGVGSSTAITCYNCNGRGHVSRQCPSTSSQYCSYRTRFHPNLDS